MCFFYVNEKREVKGSGKPQLKTVACFEWLIGKVTCKIMCKVCYFPFELFIKALLQRPLNWCLVLNTDRGDKGADGVRW